MTAPTLFVSGASGHLGRAAIELLLERNYPGHIIAGTRTPEMFADMPAVEARRADFDDSAALVAALKGVDRVLIIPPPNVDSRRLIQLNTAVKAAQAAGVKHIVCMSLMRPEPASPIAFAPQLYGTEQTLMGTGIPYTILRATWYAELLLETLPRAIETGKWLSATGEGTVAYVARNDVARAAAGALMDVEHSGSRILNVTGPHGMTRRGIVNVVAAVTGKQIAVVDVDDDTLRGELMKAGLPEEAAAFVTAFDTNTRVGRTAIVSDAVELLWGTPPQSLGEFIAANRDKLVAA